MKVLLFKEKQNMLKVSGIGRAFRQQKWTLEKNGVKVTFNPKDDFNIVHFNTVFNKSYRFLKKMKKKGVPVVVHGHSTKEDFLNSFNFAKLIKGWFYKKLKNMYSNADLIITPSNYSKGLIEGYGYVDAPVVALSNGINLKEYEYNKESVTAFKKHFNLTDSDQVVIGVGLLFERKGLHDFISVAKLMPDVKFIWFGALNKAIQTKTIKKAIKNKPKNVIMPGYIAGNIIKGAFSSANCLFFPSYEETEGIVILEAMASRLPVVLRDIPVYSEFTHEKEVLKGNNNAEFVNLIKKVLKADNKLLLDAAYSSVKEKDLLKIGKKIKILYEELLNKKQTKE